MITFVNCFTVPAGREDEFLAAWTEVNTYMKDKPGYVDHALHRSIDPAAAFRFVNVAHWESADAWRAAHDEGFRARLGAPVWRDFIGTPVLLHDQPVHAGNHVSAGA